jgi:predicted HicB family RNase H-like nuclease
LSSSAILIIKYTNMKKPLNKKLVVRITENQYHRLQQNILEDKVSMSQVIREALQNKLNKIEIDDTRKRKFRF